MSVGTWTMRLGSSSDPQLERAEQVREGHDRVLLRVTGRRGSRSTRCWARPPPAGNASHGSMKWQKRSRDPDGRRNCSTWPCPIRLRRLRRSAHGRLRLAAGHGARLPARRARVHGARRRGPDALARPLRDRAGARRAAAPSCSAGGAWPAEPGDIFFIDNSQPHVALADPGTDAPPAPRPVPPGAPRRARLPRAGPRATSRRSGWTSGRRRRGSAGRRRWPPRWRPILHQLRATWDRHDPAERHLADATLRHGPGARQPRQGHGRHRRGHPGRRGPPGADPAGARLRGRPLPREHHARRRRGPRPRQPVPRPARVQGRDGRRASRST